MITFPVTLPDGKIVEIGGEPLGSNEKLQRKFPDFYEHVLSKDISTFTNADFEDYCFHIVKHFNNDIDYDDFIVDNYTIREIVKIFMGQEPGVVDGKKK